MAVSIPPPPSGADYNSFEWQDWLWKLRSAALNPDVDGQQINVGTTGSIRGGQTSWNVGTGFFLGYESGKYRFSIGTPSGQSLTWDGTTLYINATLADNSVGLSQILDGAINELKLAAGAVTAAKTNLAAINSSSGELAANSVSANAIQANAVTSDKILAGAVTSDKIVANNLAAISADLGNITAGSITGVVITGGVLQTAPTGQRIKISTDGIQLITANPAEPYGTSSVKYGNSSNKYGSSALAWLNNAQKTIPFYINSEQPVADIHLYNRSADPTGPAQIGDLAVVNGKLKICTAGGTPGIWTVVGTQT